MNQTQMVERFFEELSKIKSSSNTIKKYPSIFITRHNRSMIVSNFGEICNKHNRDPENMKNYIETALFGKIMNDGKITLSINGILTIHQNIASSAINETIKTYLDEYCKCHQCGNFKTDLVKEERVMCIVCMACNSKKPIKMNF